MALSLSFLRTNPSGLPFFQEEYALRGYKSPLCLRSSVTDKSNASSLDRELSTSTNIKLIATDVDGTLLNSNHSLTARTEIALKKAIENGVKVVIATGKTKGPWVQNILPRLNTSAPSIFLQGLLIYDGDENLVYERTMDDEVAMELCHLAEKESVTHVAYCNDRILCGKSNFHTDRLIDYGEPIPEEVGKLKSIIGNTRIHKILYMAEEEKLINMRPSLELLLGERASVVKALPGMLEILPFGISKAVGLNKVLHTLGIEPQEVMAIGDGENDIEMLEMSGFAIAMGNSCSELKGVSDHVTLTNDEDGLAVAVEKFILT